MWIDFENVLGYDVRRDKLPTADYLHDKTSVQIMVQLGKHPYGKGNS